MSNSNSESSADFREFEHRGWEQSVVAYDTLFSPLTAQTIPAILEAVDVTPGMRVLDVATGPGRLAHALAERGALVTAIDFSPSMVDRAKTENPHANIDYCVGDAEALDFGDNTFDAVTMNYGILHLGRPTVAMSEAARVLQTGGRFAFSCWCTPDRAQGFAAVLDSVKAAGVTPPPLPPGPDFFRYSEPATSTADLQAAGFENISVTEVDQRWQLSAGEALFRAFFEGTARTGGMLRALAPEDRARVQKLVVDFVDQTFANGGAVEIPMPAIVTTGRRRSRELGQSLG